VIEVEHLTVRLGRATVVDDVSFGVDAGRSLALWGENGAGKTTAIRAILHLLPFEGRISVAGYDARRAGRQARARIGYVPQQLALYDELSALGYLRFLAGLHRQPAAGAAALLARVGLAEHAGKPVGALSGGMKQRLALAAAFIGDPPVLILDEPTANLDAAARADFLALLTGLRASGQTLLITSHRIEEVVALADDVAVLAGGRVALACPATALAEALRAGTTLRLIVAPDAVEHALATLAGDGFEARRNGTGILVGVTPGRRAAPVRTLLDRGIAIEDLAFEDTSWTPG
jgi:ABC-type multidrug transport system ATPase subunit